MKTKDLTGHISATYKWLRYWIAGIAFALPFLLGIGGYLKARLPLQDSMSAYYHGSAVFRRTRRHLRLRRLLVAKGF